MGSQQPLPHGLSSKRNINLWESDANVERYVCDWAGSVVELTLWNAEEMWDSTDGRIKFFQTERVETGRGLMMEGLIKVLGLYPRILELLKGFQQGMGSLIKYLCFEHFRCSWFRKAGDPELWHHCVSQRMVFQEGASCRLEHTDPCTQLYAGKYGCQGRVNSRNYPWELSRFQRIQERPRTFQVELGQRLECPVWRICRWGLLQRQACRWLLSPDGVRSLMVLCICLRSWECWGIRERCSVREWHFMNWGLERQFWQELAQITHFLKAETPFYVLELLPIGILTSFIIVDRHLLCSAPPCEIVPSIWLTKIQKTLKPELFLGNSFGGQT